MTLIDPNKISWDDFVLLLEAAPQFDTVVRLFGREAMRSRFDPVEIADAASVADKANERHRRRIRAMFAQYHGLSVEQIVEAFKLEGAPVSAIREDRPQLFLFSPASGDSGVVR